MSDNGNYEQQLLRLGSAAEKRISAFYARGNESTVAHIQKFCSPLADKNDCQIFVHGPAQCGKTHLLQAACRAMSESNRNSAYFSVARHLSSGTQFLAGQEKTAFLAIDDVHLAGGKDQLQLRLLRLIEAVRNTGGHLLIGSQNAPKDIKEILPDLMSRLIWGATYRLREIADHDRVDAVFFSLPPGAARSLRQPCAIF